MATVVQCNAKTIGFKSLATWLSVGSVELLSLKELTQVARGIKMLCTLVMETMGHLAMITSSLMIYLANEYLLLLNNTMTITLLLFHSA